MNIENLRNIVENATQLAIRTESASVDIPRPAYRRSIDYDEKVKGGWATKFTLPNGDITAVMKPVAGTRKLVRIEDIVYNRTPSLEEIKADREERIDFRKTFHLKDEHESLSNICGGISSDEQGILTWHGVERQGQNTHGKPYSIYTGDSKREGEKNIEHDLITIFDIRRNKQET